MHIHSPLVPNSSILTPVLACGAVNFTSPLGAIHEQRALSQGLKILYHINVQIYHKWDGLSLNK